MPRTRLYRDGKLQREDFDMSEVSDLIVDEKNTVWVDFASPTIDDLRSIVDELSLHPLAVEDAIAEHQRAKLDRYESHLFLSAYAISLPDAGDDDGTKAPTSPSGPGRLVKHEVDAFITKNALVTVRKHDDFDMTKVLERWDAHPSITKAGVGALVWGLMDTVVDTHFDTVQELDERVDALEEAVFEDRPNTIEIQRDAYTAHKHLVTLRRLALPMREITTEFMRVEGEFVDDKVLQPYFQDVYDHTLRVADWTDSLRDLVSTIIDTNLTAQGNRMNLVMKKVTSWAAIIAVPTLVTGFYGMNVKYPLINTVAGYWVSLGLMVAASGILYWQFKRNDWL
ncbi:MULTISPECIES: magnesium transporter CorA family protein [unclassified Plantibacter]|jgi:magnesium transporter|uniref:magnesium transporter CorA family protein n=1 Tax=unclassified Plantibacter TaxID=2624265 RepID=UPI003D35763C